MNRSPAFGLIIVFLSIAALHATETENLGIRVLPAPGKVVVDGNFDDWELSGSMLICSDMENRRNEYASWQSAMYDVENLYLLSCWIDQTPLNNPSLVGSDLGFAGDCLQVRIIASSAGSADAKADEVEELKMQPAAWGEFDFV
jgi:hypothetical protein